MQELAEESDADDWTHIPLYDMLKWPKGRHSDKVNQVFHGHDCWDDMTAITIFSHPNFPHTCIEFINRLECGEVSKLVDAECETGCHRASTFAYTCAALANRLENADGQRLYNVRVFPLYKYTQWGPLKTQIESAVEHAYNPWGLAAGGADKPIDQLPFYAATNDRKEAAQNWEKIFTYVDELNAAVLAAARPRPRELSVSPSPSESPPAKRHKPAPWNRGEVFKASMRMPTLSQESWDASPPVFETELQKYVKVGPIELAEVWSDELNKHRVDAKAQKALFLLSQTGPDHFKAACGIVAKLFKKDIDDEYIAKPSAFVWTCVKNTYDKLGW